MVPKITDIELHPVTTKRVSGLPSQHIIVFIHTDCQLTGIGEMSDLSHLPAVVPDLQDLERCMNLLLRGQNPFNIEKINKILLQNFPGTRFYGKCSIIRCGIDVALYDLLGKLTNQPVYNLIGGRVREKIPVCCPIFRPTTEEQVAENLVLVERYIKQGMCNFRYYFGHDFGLDEMFLAEAFRRHGDQFRLVSLDASGRLTVKEFLRGYRRLSKFEFEMVESPVNRDDLQGIAEVRRRIDHPVSEHIRSLEYGRRAICYRAVDIFNISITVAGGITYAKKLSALAESADLACLIGTTQELSVGTAAGAHLGVSMANLSFVSNPTGPLVYTEDVVQGTLRFDRGYLYPPQGPGLGVKVDQERLACLREELTMHRHVQDKFSRG